jgi:hypothetical protein
MVVPPIFAHNQPPHALRLLAALYALRDMDIQEYYDKAKSLGNDLSFSKTEEASQLASVLDYDDESDHPSSWVPKVQSILLNAYVKFPDEKYSQSLINLYNSGVILEQRAQNSSGIILCFTAFALGIFIGWLVWA